MLALAVLLLVAWVLAFVAFEVTSALIHLLLLVAALALIGHFVRRRARPLE